MPQLTSTGLESAKEKKVFAGVYDPDKVPVMQRVAGEFAGRISVKEFNPKDIEERREFAELMAAKEAVRYRRGPIENGASASPRTADQIESGVIGPAERSGRALVAIESTMHEIGQDLSGFNQRVNEELGSGIQQA